MSNSDSSWVDDVLDGFFIMRAGTPDDNLEELKLRNELGIPEQELKQKILQKMNEARQDGIDDAFLAIVGMPGSSEYVNAIMALKSLESMGE